MWIYVWAVFAFLMLGFAVWNIVIMWQQKKAWKMLSDKWNLNYESTGFMNSPVVSGKIDKAYFSLFSGVQKTEDVRGERFVTAIEFTLGNGMPTGAALGTSRMKSFIDMLAFNDTYEPDHEDWRDDYVLLTRDEEGLRAYLNDERLKALCGIFRMKGATVLLFFDELECVLRVETPDPLRDYKHLNKIIKRLSEAVKVLTPSIEEKRKFKKILQEEEKRQEEKERKRLEFDPDQEGHEIELELEDDDEPVVTEAVELALDEDDGASDEKTAEDVPSSNSNKEAAKKTAPAKKKS